MSLPLFCAQAKVKVLIVPVGNIELNVFREYFDALKSFETVPLADCTFDQSKGHSN